MFPTALCMAKRALQSSCQHETCPHRRQSGCQTFRAILKGDSRAVGVSDLLRTCCLQQTAAICTYSGAVNYITARLLLLVGCLTSQQHASVSQGRICTDNFTCCHTEMEAADQTFHLTQSQYTDTGPTSPSADPITPGAWQGSHWSANF